MVHTFVGELPRKQGVEEQEEARRNVRFGGGSAISGSRVPQKRSLRQI